MFVGSWCDCRRTLSQEEAVPVSVCRRGSCAAGCHCVCRGRPLCGGGSETLSGVHPRWAMPIHPQDPETPPPSPCCGPFKGGAGPPGGGAHRVTSSRLLIKAAGFPGRQRRCVLAGPRARGAAEPRPWSLHPPAPAMESAGLFPPFPAASLPARPAPAPAPPPRAAETTRIITDPISGRSYCKGRLLGKVPGMGKGSWAVAEGAGFAGVSRCGRGGGRGLRACSTPHLRRPGAACSPSAAACRPHPPRLSRRARSSAGSSESPGLAACLGGYRSSIGFGAPRGVCVGRWVPRFPGVPARAAPPHATFPPAVSSV